MKRKGSLSLLGGPSAGSASNPPVAGSNMPSGSVAKAHETALPTVRAEIVRDDGVAAEPGVRSPVAQSSSKVLGCLPAGGANMLNTDGMHGKSAEAIMSGTSSSFASGTAQVGGLPIRRAELPKEDEVGAYGKRAGAAGSSIPSSFAGSVAGERGSEKVSGVPIVRAEIVRDDGIYGAKAEAAGPSIPRSFAGSVAGERGSEKVSGLPIVRAEIVREDGMYGAKAEAAGPSIPSSFAGSVAGERGSEKVSGLPIVRAEIVREDGMYGAKAEAAGSSSARALAHSSSEGLGSLPTAKADMMRGDGTYGNTADAAGSSAASSFASSLAKAIPSAGLGRLATARAEIPKDDGTYGKNAEAAGASSFTSSPVIPSQRLGRSPNAGASGTQQGVQSVKHGGLARYHRAASLPDQPSPVPRMSCLKKANTDNSLDLEKVLRFAPEVEIKELSPRSPCSPACFSPAQAVLKGTPVDVDVKWLQQLGHVTLDMAEKEAPAGSTARSSSWPNEQRAMAGGDKQLLQQHSMPVRSSHVEAAPTMQGMARRQSMLPSQFGRPEAALPASQGGGKNITSGAFGGSAPAKGIVQLPHSGGWSEGAGGSKQGAQASKGVQDLDAGRSGGSHGNGQGGQGQAHGQGAWPSPNPGVKHGVVHDSQASMTREVPRWFAKSEKTVQSDAPRGNPQAQGATGSQGGTSATEKGFMVWKQPVEVEGGGAQESRTDVSPFGALAQYLYHMVQPPRDAGREGENTNQSPLALAAPQLRTTVNCPNELVDACERHHKRERHQSSPHHSSQSSPRKHMRRRKSKKHEEAFVPHGSGDNVSASPRGHEAAHFAPGRHSARFSEPLLISLYK